MSEREASERVNVVQTLLASADLGTVEAVQILLLNCIKSSATNSSGLATSLGGRKLLGQLLTLFEAMSDDDDDDGERKDDDEDDVHDDEAEDFGVGDLQIEESIGIDHQHPSTSNDSSKSSTPTTSRTTSQSKVPSAAAAKKARQARQARQEAHASSVKIGYAIFSHLFEYGLFKHIYRTLSPRRIEGAPSDDPNFDSIVTTEQTLLLKTADAWINAGAKKHSMNDESSVDQFRRLPFEMAKLCRFLREALAQAKTTSTPDRRVVGVHQALVLVLEILIQLGMIGCEGLEGDEQFKAECEELLRLMRGGHPNEELDTVREIVETLRVSNEFAPPVSPFTSGGRNGTNAPPQGHSTTSTGRNTGDASQPFRLDNLNRSLVQLLGVLAFQHSASSLPQSFKEDRTAEETAEESRLIGSVQDRTRESGGLLTVISLTQVDERNPYIREHALFTLRYLLQGNLESQELVGKLQPVVA